MNDEHLRALVRESIQRHLGRPSEATGGQPSSRLEISHGRFNMLVGADTGGPCIIEPAVSCNHCGYCQSYGH